LIDRARRRFALTIFITVGFDVVTKSIALASLSKIADQKQRVLGNFLSFHLVHNSGAAFSLAPTQTRLLTAFSIATAALIIYRAREFTNNYWLLAAGLVVGGISGNLCDRLFRSPGALSGSVVDWIELPHWPTFNLADSSIVLGAALAAILILREIPSRQIQRDAQFTSKGDQDE